MAHALETPLLPMIRDFRELQSRGRPLVLATVIATEGSTYRKAGTPMLITESGQARGLLSGGCLEVDLVEHARDVLESGAARLAEYDMRGEDDRVFGIGSGCEGAMRVLLQRVGPSERWQPLEAIAARVEARDGGAVAIVVDGAAAGRGWWPGGGDAPASEPPEVREARGAGGPARIVESRLDGARVRVLVMPLAPPPRLLLCGAGDDARPLAQQAVALGFDVTVCDHRPALASAARFPHCRVRCQPADAFARVPELASADAAIVMSHHLEADALYLGALAVAPQVGYVGLLGPAPRRDRLLGMLGPVAARLGARLHAPIGLDIGARTPEAIALAAAGELHAWLAGRAGGAWHDKLPPPPQ
jgi:xanthine/CO dehydrogenase XdhC/CoxF family maturation factor